MSFIDEIKEKAKKDIKTIVLPESTDVRVLEAASKIKNEKFANVVLVGNEDDINKLANENNFLIGNNDRNWKADLDFLLRPDKATAILENKYSNKKSGIDDFKELWKEAQNEQTGNNTGNNSFSW